MSNFCVSPILGGCHALDPHSGLGNLGGTVGTCSFQMYLFRTIRKFVFLTPVKWFSYLIILPILCCKGDSGLKSIRKEGYVVGMVLHCYPRINKTQEIVLVDG